MRIGWFFLIIFMCIAIIVSCNSNVFVIKEPKAEKLHWFIPDGMRADPFVFDVFSWAEDGKLPNIKKLMDQGSYGYSIPTFPTHTPTNFATLLTGAYPKVHGVADGPMHIEGFPLSKPSVAGFSSKARKIPAVWSLFEEMEKEVVLLSVPGSTPPELQSGKIIRGRWGGWGADFHSLIFESKSKQEQNLGRGKRLFFLGYELTNFIESAESILWGEEVKVYSPSLDLRLDIHGAKMYAKIIDTSDDDAINYDYVAFSKDKERVSVVLGEGQWSDWIPITFIWKDQEINTFIKLHVIKLESDGFFRIRVVVDNLNDFIVQPRTVSDDIHHEIGPMVDFVDNFPPQLIYYDEDKNTFLDELGLSFDWHTQAVDAVYALYDPDVFIHDIYSPNQMLTSRWWMGYIDPSSERYDDISGEERELLWQEVKDMYLKLDGIVGKAIENVGDNTLIVLSSDHGATPLNVWVRLNNLFAEKGWLKYSWNEATHEPIIDYENSQVIYLKMDNVYINPNGLGPNWVRGKGEAYENLREEVRESLNELEYEHIKVVDGVFNWEDVDEFLDLPKERVGNLVIANKAGFGWNEELSKDGKIFTVPLKTGYKQAIFANTTEGMWTPFIISGPGIRKGYKLKEPIQHVDQLPTILSAMDIALPSHVQGNTLTQILI
tara:strand:+ start:97 stop:2076 length:1980 start_codon:yes stop_codon:yes gene_type:complete